MSLRIPILWFISASLCLLECAPTGSHRQAAGAAPADSIAFAYIPGGLAQFPDYQSFRENDFIRSEIMSLDLSLRENDYVVEEVGQSDFEALRGLAASDSAVDPAAIASLQYGPRRLLLILDVPVKGNGRASGKTMASDILHNAGAIAGAIEAMKVGGFGAKPQMRHTSETGHGFRAILFDRESKAILLDTVSSVLTGGGKAPGQTGKESPGHWHYRTFIQAKVKGP